MGTDESLGQKVWRIVSDLDTIRSLVTFGWPFIAGPLSALLAFITRSLFWVWLLTASALWLLGAILFLRVRSRSYGRRQQSSPARDLRFSELPAHKIEKWGGASRLSLEVHNEGESGDFEAGVIPPVQGLPDDPRYGNFFLQWDLQSAYQKHIPSGRSAILRVAYAHDGNVRFLGPETDLYKPLTVYKTLRPPGPITADVEVRQSYTDRFAVAKVEIGFNEDGEPYLRIVDSHR